MDKQPVGQLPDLTQSNNDDEIMVITNSEYNQLKKEKISDFITDLQSTNTNNSLTTGSDGKLFVSKTINASDVDGVLSLDNIPQLSTNKLPETGISADNYSYPSSITVNDRGQVVSITEGSAAEAGAYLDQSQITNCILEAPNGVATFSGSNITLKQGLKMLYPNGRNIDKTLKNGELTLDSDSIIDLSSYSGQTFDFELMFGCNINDSYLSQNYQESDVAPTNTSGFNQIYLNTTENQMYFYNSSSSSWDKKTLIKLGKGKLENGVVTSFIPYQPVELAKNNDVVHNTGDEKIGGQKQFLRPYKIDCRESEHKSNAVMYLTGLNRTAGQTNYTGPSIYSYAPNYDMTDESAANQANAFGPQLLPLDKNGQWWGHFQFYNSYFDGEGQSVSSAWGVRRYIDGVLKSANVSLGVSPSSSWFSFPKCNARPTTTSSASTNCVDVIVKNYHSGSVGYVQFGSGLKIQWGILAWNQATTYTVIFPLSFMSGTSYVIFKNYGYWAASEAQDREVSFYNKTATSAQTFGEFSSTTIYTDWLAIGY